MKPEASCSGPLLFGGNIPCKSEKPLPVLSAIRSILLQTDTCLMARNSVEAVSTAKPLFVFAVANVFGLRMQKVTHISFSARPAMTVIIHVAAAAEICSTTMTPITQMTMTTQNIPTAIAA